jgi:hypothetical protein
VGIAFGESKFSPNFGSRCGVFLLRTFQKRRPRCENTGHAN